MLLILILLLLIFGLGGGYYGYNRWGYNGGLGIVGLLVVILLLFWLIGGFGALHGVRLGY